MSEELVVSVAREAIWTVIKVAGPMLVAGLVVGISVSIFQALTSIQDVTLTFIPKILGIFTVLLISLRWIMNTLLRFTNELFQNTIPGVG